MTKDELLNSSEEELLQEVRRLQYIFGHSQIIRHGLNRDTEEYQTQSVAEHIYNMMILAQYFRPLEDPAGEWDWEKIHRMILWHDAGELETGDIVTHHKDENHEIQERQAHEQVIDNSPDILQKNIRHTLDEFEYQASPEARFVKSLDKLEVCISTYSKHGKHRFVNAVGASREVVDGYIASHLAIVEEFPVIKKMIQVIHSRLLEEQYYKE